MDSTSWNSGNLYRATEEIKVLMLFEWQLCMLNFPVSYFKQMSINETLVKDRCVDFFC